MSELNSEPVFLVNSYMDPVVVKMKGRASYLNCEPFSAFVKQMCAAGKNNFLVDFYECTGIDSTVLGIFANLALRLRKMDPAGSLTLARLSERHLELVQNLGLHRMVKIIQDSDLLAKNSDAKPLKEGSADQELILNAHKALIEVDSENLKKFQDVVSFLEIQMAQPEKGDE